MIPHNGTLSNGMQFALNDIWGKPFDEEYAQRRGSQ
jgi:hypothetical protein